LCEKRFGLNELATELFLLNYFLDSFVDVSKPTGRAWQVIRPTEEPWRAKQS
jgi:hypothetical protein